MSIVLPPIYRDSRILLVHTDELVHRLFQWYRRQKRFVLDDRLCHGLFAQLQTQLAIYWGHFGRANSFRLKYAVFVKYSWLADYFELQTNGVFRYLFLRAGKRDANRHCHAIQLSLLQHFSMRFI